MFTSTWFVSAMALLVVDVRTGALQQKDAVAHRCFSCAHNETACEVSSLSTVACPASRPLCATTVIAPNFTSSLDCAFATKTPCSLTYNPENGFQFTCVCIKSLCNVPFTVELKNKLLNFLSTNFTNNNTSDYAEAFFKFANYTGDNIYKEITVSTASTNKTLAQNISVVANLASKTVSLASKTVSLPALSRAIEVILPHAEALKHEATAPSDDDEDDSEGSGSYEEPKLRQPASDPAAPSSFLPAHENKASTIIANLLVATSILICFIA